MERDIKNPANSDDACHIMQNYFLLYGKIYDLVVRWITE